jgi:hypothetical protein
MDDDSDMMGMKFDAAQISNGLHQLAEFELRPFFTDDEVTSLLKKYDWNVEVVRQQMKEKMA